MFQSLVVIIVSNNKRRIILIDVVFIATYCIQIHFFLKSLLYFKQARSAEQIYFTKKKKLFRPRATIFKLKNPKNKLFIWCGLNISSLKINKNTTGLADTTKKE